MSSNLDSNSLIKFLKFKKKKKNFFGFYLKSKIIKLLTYKKKYIRRSLAITRLFYRINYKKNFKFYSKKKIKLLNQFKKYKFIYQHKGFKKFQKYASRLLKINLAPPLTSKKFSLPKILGLKKSFSNDFYKIKRASRQLKKKLLLLPRSRYASYIELLKKKFSFLKKSKLQLYYRQKKNNFYLTSKTKKFLKSVKGFSKPFFLYGRGYKRYRFNVKKKFLSSFTKKYFLKFFRSTLKYIFNSYSNLKKKTFNIIKKKIFTNMIIFINFPLLEKKLLFNYNQFFSKALIKKNFFLLKLHYIKILSLFLKKIFLNNLIKKKFLFFLFTSFFFKSSLFNSEKSPWSYQFLLGSSSIIKGFYYDDFIPNFFKLSIFKTSFFFNINSKLTTFHTNFILIKKFFSFDFMLNFSDNFFNCASFFFKKFDFYFSIPFSTFSIFENKKNYFYLPNFFSKLKLRLKQKYNQRLNLVALATEQFTNMIYLQLFRRLSNFLMRRGKKTQSKKIFFKTLFLLKKRTKTPPILFFTHALRLLAPFIWLKTKKIAGKRYQIPFVISETRSLRVAMRWLIKAARLRKRGKNISDRLAREIISSCKGRGRALKLKKRLFRVARKNRFYARWNPKY